MEWRLHASNPLHLNLPPYALQQQHTTTELVTTTFVSSSLLSVMELPVVDLSRYLESSGDELGSDLLDSCREVSRILKETGALLVKDPRCSAQDNDRFIDMMETYFQKPDDFKRLQQRPNLHYQVSQDSLAISIFKIDSLF